jgi:hypothetical protein
LFALRAQADTMSGLHQSPESMISGYSSEITRKDDDKHGAPKLSSRRNSTQVQGDNQMKKTVLTFGLISGAIMTAMMFGTLPFTNSAWLQAHSMVIGYTTMVLSFMLVFFGIRSYRENIGGGTITFGRAFAVGILITVISSVSYVVTWEIMYFGIPSFGERFMTMCVAHVKSSGASPEAIQRELNQLKYLDNPFINAALTFTEPFPVGLIITLISALILRKKPKPQSGESPATAAA